MVIKEELEKLRKEQEQLEREIEMKNDKKENEMRSLQKTEQRLIQFEGKNSKIAKKIYEELYQETMKSKENIKRIEEYIKKCKNKHLTIKSRIDELCYDTSLYINEQVNYLILEFMNYVKKNEIRLGKNIINEFRIESCKYCVGKVPYHYMEPDGYFEIEQGSERVAVTKDYYFNNEIIVGHTDWDCVLSDWYKKYENDFIKSFLKSLKKDFYSENFKVVDVDDRLGKFTIELI